MNPPLLFIAMGQRDDALLYAIQSVRRFSPETPVHVICSPDWAGKLPVEVTIVPLDPCMTAANRFAEVYAHHSQNSLALELTCFQRWFVTLEYTLAANIPEFWAFDWDVLIFDDLAKFVPPMAMSVPEGEFYCRDRERLRIWCDYLMAAYTEKNRHYQAVVADYMTRETLAVSDMYWARLRWPYCHSDHLTRIIEGAYFDHNLACPDNGFETRGGSKLLEWREHVPYAWNETRREWIRMRSLHCWGPHRQRMKEYLEK